MSFRDDFRDFQYLTLNVLLVRRHNLIAAIKVTQADPNLPAEEKAKRIHQQMELLAQMPHLPEDTEDRLLFAEGALNAMAIERFLRMVMGKTGEAHKGVTLDPLLRDAVKSKTLTLLPGMDVDKAIKSIGLVRNTMLHGNYEQIAHSLGYATVQEFFWNEFTPAIEMLYQLLDHFTRQIDPATGKPHPVPPTRAA